MTVMSVALSVVAGSSMTGAVGVTGQTGVTMTGVTLTGAVNTTGGHTTGETGMAGMSPGDAAAGAAAEAPMAAEGVAGETPVMCSRSVRAVQQQMFVRGMGMPVGRWTLGHLAAPSAVLTRCSGWGSALTDDPVLGSQCRGGIREHGYMHD
jgi:hypothetical protein